MMCSCCWRMRIESVVTLGILQFHQCLQFVTLVLEAPVIQQHRNCIELGFPLKQLFA
ncbi:hypothetical protein D3C78_1628320 [compost metagenome]